MNIFFVNRDPYKAAEDLVDKHVVKMILETAQLLSTAHRIMDGEMYIDDSSGRRIKRWKLHDSREMVMYQATHINHPCAVWCRESVENYNWLHDHLMGLLAEYSNRYKKVHSVQGELSLMLGSPPHNLKDWDWTEPPLAMPEEYQTYDLVESYRNYYRDAKKHLHHWKDKSPPVWL